MIGYGCYQKLQRYHGHAVLGFAVGLTTKPTSQNCPRTGKQFFGCLCFGFNLQMGCVQCCICRAQGRPCTTNTLLLSQVFVSVTCCFTSLKMMSSVVSADHRFVVIFRVSQKTQDAVKPICPACRYGIVWPPYNFQTERL